MVVEREKAKIVFDADLESGSMDRVVRLGVDWYQVMLRPNVTNYFYFRAKGCRGREIIFECRPRILPVFAKCPMAGKGVWPPDEPPYSGAFPLVSYDQKTWSKVDHCENTWDYERSYRFRHTFTEDVAYLCKTYPYTYSDVRSWLQSIEDNPCVKVGSVGRTRTGVIEPLLTITENPAARDLVVLIAREDCDENGGSLGIEGVVRRLLAPECKAVRQRYVFQIVPMVSIDGVIAGARHSAGYSYGGCHWHEESSPAEIENVKRAIAEWVGQGYRLRLAGKLHAGSVYGEGMLESQDVLASNPALMDALTQYRDEYWRGIHTPLAIRPKGLFERFMLDAFKFGDTFATHIQAPTPENARRCGEGLMRNIELWLTEAAEQ